jgi:hypothetical protein
MPWEEHERGFGDRLLSTLSATFAPVRTVHAAAVGPLAPALRFAFLTMLPCMLLWGITPFTAKLKFGPSFAVVVTKGADQAAIALDIAYAAALGLGLSLFTWLSWSVPFASLTAAFAPAPNTGAPARLAAWRCALYRGWVIPAGLLVLYTIEWMYPASLAIELLAVVVLICQLVPRMLVVVHCQTLARYLGASYLGAIGVALVPLVFEWVVTSVAMTYARGLFPEMPTSP